MKDPLQEYDTRRSERITCPRCHGKGVAYKTLHLGVESHTPFATHEPCYVCKGAKMIRRMTITVHERIEG